MELLQERIILLVLETYNVTDDYWKEHSFMALQVGRKAAMSVIFANKSNLVHPRRCPLS